MKIKVELEMEIDMKELSIAEIKKIIDQLVQADDSKVVKNVHVSDFKIVG